MPETKTMTVGSKTYKVRKTVPQQIVDLAIKEQTKLDAIVGDEERGIASLKVKSALVSKMVIEPKLDDKYIEEEADLDDVELSFDIFAEVIEAVRDRFEVIKKKHPSLFGLKPEVPEKIG